MLKQKICRSCLQLLAKEYKHAATGLVLQSYVSTGTRKTAQGSSVLRRHDLPSPMAKHASIQFSRAINSYPFTRRGLQQFPPFILQHHLRLYSQLPHFHRPTKEELLQTASSVFERMKIRFKFATLKQYRPFNADEIGALFSWFILGHIVWIVVGTTTFVSLFLLAVNTLSAQEYFAKIVGDYLTKETGVSITFESAIVPKWKNGTISLSKVFISRRPELQTGEKQRVRKGSSTTAAAVRAAAATSTSSTMASADPQDNYARFDLMIDSVDVTLSFVKWMNGKGLLKDVSMRGLRGVVDRQHITYSGDDDPQSYRHRHATGDFEIDSFRLEDLLVTIHQPSCFRPFLVSVFACDLPRLRKQWLFYDLLSANTISGSYDNSLFTLHPRQSSGQNDDEVVQHKVSRLRVDGVDIEHLNRGVEGPFGWIQQGTVDVVADMELPLSHEVNLTKIVQGVVDHIEGAVNKHPAHLDDDPKIYMEILVKLNNTRAAVPLFTHDLTYINNALIRPIVAYINSRRTLIPIRCSVEKQLSEFDGSWTVYDSGLMGAVSAEVIPRKMLNLLSNGKVYAAFARSVQDESERRRRVKMVGGYLFQSVLRYVAAASQQPIRSVQDKFAYNNVFI